MTLYVNWYSQGVKGQESWFDWIIAMGYFAFALLSSLFLQSLDMMVWSQHLSFQENVLLRKDLEGKEDDKKGNMDIPPDTRGTMFFGYGYWHSFGIFPTGFA